MSTRCWMIGSIASSLSIVAAIVSRSASFCARWPIERGKFGAIFFGLP